MPLFSISAAARVTGKNRATISRHIKEGKLSATKDKYGNVAITQDELLRVYGELAKPDTLSALGEKPAKDAELTRLKMELEETRERLKSAESREVEALERERAAREREQWLRREIEEWKQRAGRVLPSGDADEKEGNPTETPGFWGRLFRKL